MATGLFNLKQVNQAISQGAWSGYIAPKWVEYLVVAGGGGGGQVGGGGGGGGGLLTGIVTVAANTSYTVTVGSGGNGTPSGSGNQSVKGSSGSNSVFSALTATGGGGGGSYGDTSNNGLSGGSGGGGGTISSSGQTFAGGLGANGQGNNGGNGYGSVNTVGGGGGGAGTAGLSGTSAIGGNGGAGVASSISGSVVTYAGGGGGGEVLQAAGSGGVGGGGSANTNAAGTSGSPNTGGGGGGCSYDSSTYFSGGNGGSGIVVVRYPGNVQFYTGGAITYANGYIVHTFVASGTLAPTTPAVVASDYQISRSLRFNSPDSANLTRTPASATNQKTWTWSGWVKRSALYANLSNPATIFNAGGNGFLARFSYANPDQLEFYNYSGAAYQLQVITTAQYRDPSAWYHIVFALDTTQATSSNRFKVYVNGVQVTAFGTATYPSQNSDMLVNGTSVHALGVLNGIGGYYDGYMTEINFIDGQALTPSSFGATNANTGVWGPKAYTGTYGTNGFYLNFSDNSNTTAATLGKDYSGNGNNFTPNNFSVTAGTGNDSLVDSPTNYGTDYGVGGAVRGNYATMNPLALKGSVTLSNGNLDAYSVYSGDVSYATIAISSGKWYWEATPISGGGAYMIGISKDVTPLTDWQSVNGFAYYSVNGNRYNSGVGVSYGATFTTNDVIGVALDMDAGTLVFYKNGTSQGVAFSGLSGTYFASHQNPGANNTVTFNFGQRAFAYTPPGGFKALCTQNFPAPAIATSPTTLATKYFNTITWTGDGATTRSFTGIGFQPDFSWLKSRSLAYSHLLFNAVVGAGTNKALASNSTVAESGLNDDAINGYLSSFDSDGFSVVRGSTPAYTNNNGETYVSWNWKANGSGSTNTSGSITSTVSASTTSGFSVVTYTGTGALATVGHGLGVAPYMVIVKRRNGVANWATWHISIGTQVLFLDLTDAAVGGSAQWNGAVPTSTVFTVNTSSGVNGSGGTYVAYCFAPVPGYSAFGSYTGNGSTDGPFVYTGFRPAYIMYKRTDSISDWGIVDTTRNPSNVVGEYLAADLINAGATYSMLDILSNGFKPRWNDTSNNASGGTYIYMAFASSPFKYSLAR